MLVRKPIHCERRCHTAYGETVLGWAISTGSKMEIKDVAELKDSKIGVSRIGRCVALPPFTNHALSSYRKDIGQRWTLPFPSDG